MIQPFVDRFLGAADQLRAEFAAQAPESYIDIVRAVVKIIAGDEYDRPDHTRIHQFDDSSYQGTLVFVIGAHGYQPKKYWYVRVSYGSCSGCDTLEHLRANYNRASAAKIIDGYYTLALHVVQRMKEMDGELV